MYAEILPDECPPLDASDDALEGVFRLVANNPPTAEDFFSKAKLGISGNGNQDDCAWASCSLFINVRPLLKYRRLLAERPFVATVDIPANQGKSIKRSNHIDFWGYSTCFLETFVAKIEHSNDL